MLGNLVEEFRDVARSKHPVNRREVGRSLFGVEVGREYAAGDALPSQELARAARSASSSTASTAASRVSATAHLPISCSFSSFFNVREGSYLLIRDQGFEICS